jgi:hypothetical protein
MTSAVERFGWQGAGAEEFQLKNTNRANHVNAQGSRATRQVDFHSTIAVVDAQPYKSAHAHSCIRHGRQQRNPGKGQPARPSSSSSSSSSSSFSSSPSPSSSQDLVNMPSPSASTSKTIVLADRLSDPPVLTDPQTIAPPINEDERKSDALGREAGRQEGGEAGNDPSGSGAAGSRKNESQAGETPFRHGGDQRSNRKEC